MRNIRCAADMVAFMWKFRRRRRDSLDRLADKLIEVIEAQSESNEILANQTSEIFNVLKDQKVTASAPVAGVHHCEHSSREDSSPTSKASPKSNILNVLIAGVSAIAVILQVVILQRQTDLSEAQTRLDAQQQVLGTDSYDYSVSELITISSPKDGKVTIRNNSSTALFDFYVRLQGVGEINLTGNGESESPRDLAFVDLLTPVVMIGSCKEIEFSTPTSIPDSDDNPIVDWSDGREKDAKVENFDPETATLAYRGSQHWWAINQNRGIYRLNVDLKSDEEEALSPEESVELIKGIPEDDALLDTILEGVDRWNISTTTAPVVLDNEKLNYPGVAKDETEVEQSSVEECSY